MGRDKIRLFMKSIASEGALKGKKTNHSVRKTMITFLASSNIPDTQIMQLCGHKSIHNLNSYKHASLQPQQDRTHIFSSYNQKVKPEKRAFSTRLT